MALKNTKQAEKEYLRRSAGGQWEASKPFPAPGQSATDEHAQHLQDFAVLLRVLDPGPSELILDLGAGSCWVSDWLRRCAVQTVAVDIAFDMLKLGSTRLGSASGLTVGDMEHLPFADNSFGKACCLNAFHHVPDADAALREIKRVLKPNGVAFFSEPGAGHADHPTSIAASQNYGVLENEILIEKFMESCLAAGFADVRLHPISHIVPLFALDKDQWADWNKFTSSQRPVRALHKMWRAALELLGIGKGTVLFEEAFAIRLLRELQPVIVQHPIVTAHRSPFVRPTRMIDGAEIELVGPPSIVPPRSDLTLQVRIVNVGTTSWNATGIEEEIRLGVQLLASDGSVVDRNFARQRFPMPLLPGADCQVSVRLQMPASRGTYQLKLDVIREGVRWFEMGGSRPLVHSVDVSS